VPHPIKRTAQKKDASNDFFMTRSLASRNTVRIYAAGSI
jgi:hypothetical protein